MSAGAFGDENGGDIGASTVPSISSPTNVGKGTAAAKDTGKSTGSDALGSRKFPAMGGRKAFGAGIKSIAALKSSGRHKFAAAKKTEF